MSQEERRERIRLTWCICLALAAIVVVVYAPASRFEFLDYDDDIYVTENPAVQAGITLEGLRWALTFCEIGHWHPLTWISHMLDCEFFGLNAGGHHITSIVLHAITAVLLFLLLHQMTGAIWPSGFTAALFAIHPLRVESVAWVSERKDVLSGLFFMMTLLAYERYVRKPDSRLRYIAVVLLFALGLLSKNMLVTLPFIMLLLDYWPLQRLDLSVSHRLSSTRRLVIEKVPLFALSVASCVATSLSTETISPAGRWPFVFRIENAAVSYVTYIWRMFVPTDLAVPYMIPPGGVALQQFVPAFCLLVAVTCIVIVLRQWRPYLVVGWFWFLGMSVPIIGLIQISYYSHADRYTYLPQIGLALTFTWLVRDLTARWRWRRPILELLAFIIIAALMVRTSDQVSVWRNSFTLWTNTLKVMPYNVYGHNGLGLIFAKQGRLDQAIQHYENALKSKPDFVQTLNNLGNALLEQKKPDEAIARFRDALRAQPDLALTHNNLGNALGVAERTDEAITEYLQAIRLKPDFAVAYGNLGNALFAQNRIDEAVTAFRHALRLRPNSPNHQLSFGNALLKQGKVEEAIAQLSKVLSFGQTEAEVRVSLADALVKQGRFDEAIAHCQAALRLKPELPEAYYQLGKALSKQKLFPEAIRQYEQALRLKPDYAEAHNNLGNLLAATGHIEQAVPHYERALMLQPENAEAHNNFGGLLLQQSRVAEAITEYEAALRLNTNFVAALRNLAWIRAASVESRFRDGAKALELARRAVELTGNNDASALDALAAAFAELGKFEDAVRIANVAHELALAANQIPIASQMETRLKLYRMRSPYRLK